MMIMVLLILHVPGTCVPSAKFHLLVLIDSSLKFLKLLNESSIQITGRVSTLASNGTSTWSSVMDERSEERMRFYWGLRGEICKLVRKGNIFILDTNICCQTRSN